MKWRQVRADDPSAGQEQEQESDSGRTAHDGHEQGDIDTPNVAERDRLMSNNPLVDGSSALRVLNGLPERLTS